MRVSVQNVYDKFRNPKTKYSVRICLLHVELAASYDVAVAMSWCFCTRVNGQTISFSNLLL